jgi:predicted  nucleic acid-binding Zn-ribbon protein
MNRLLWDLQQTDNLITRLKRERSKLDDGTHARSERDTVQRARDESKAQLNTLNSQRSDKETELQATEEKIARQNSRLMNAKNAHEVTSLQRDIQALGNARSDLDEAVLMLMDEIETTSNQLVELEKQLVEHNVQTTRIERNFASETKRIDREIEEAFAMRKEVTAQLDADALKMYDEVTRLRHGVAVAVVENGNCSVCGNALTPFNLRDAKTQTWPTCENCERLLFIE